LAPPRRRADRPRASASGTLYWCPLAVNSLPSIALKTRCPFAVNPMSSVGRKATLGTRSLCSPPAPTVRRRWPTAACLAGSRSVAATPSPAGAAAATAVPSMRPSSQARVDPLPMVGLVVASTAGALPDAGHRRRRTCSLAVRPLPTARPTLLRSTDAAPRSGGAFPRRTRAVREAACCHAPPDQPSLDAAPPLARRSPGCAASKAAAPWAIPASPGKSSKRQIRVSSCGGSPTGWGSPSG